ncbi:gastrula zinc finger protein XlCGF53.1-like isoform X2 [Xenopus laevis]|uniref:Gastrula zinc finger protein XlCGF53.1-like isoform X2 n=1 Tax=Xenopus laevis TaxID=8355 RepID=A0A8J1KQN1_XENLA|nr:gastrula zinc finger protein XlCGF53.1-like isoform X2 [Xenopus laevis]
MGISQEPTEPVMGNQDPDQLHETILTLTLEIIYLLTGESCTDCMLGGACRHHVTSATVAPPPGSVIQKENAKKILELMSNIIQLLTGEVAIRCEDVSLYFSLEEWQYLKGNKSRYREVIKENWEQLLPLGGEYGGGRDSEWDVGADVRNANKPDKTEAEEADSWGEGNPPNPDISPTDPQTLTNCISHGIKEESWEEEEHCEWNTDPPTEQIQGTDPPTDTVGSHLNISQSDNHSPSGIKEEQRSGSDPTSDTRGSSLNNSLSDSNRIKEESDSWEDCTNWTMNAITEPGSSVYSNLSEHSISHTVRGETASWDGGNPSDCSMYVLVGQGTEPSSKVMGSNPKSSLCLSDGSSCTNGGLTSNKGASDSKFNPMGTPRTDPAAHILGPKLRAADASGNEHSPYVNIRVLATTQPGTPNPKMMYTCSTCEKPFTSRKHCERHQRVHTRETTFPCTECGKVFTQRSHLTAHSRMHSGDNSFTCSQCGKCFLFQSDLNRHVITHTGEKPFTCSECGKRFGHLYSLKRHLIVHTGTKPFSCTQCGKCFGHQGDLNRHGLIHSGHKPFSCTRCGKCFWLQRDLTRHVRTHTDLSQGQMIDLGH